VARFADRRAAGKALATELAAVVQPGDDVVVLALPRGGVPVGYEVAQALRAEFDVFVVRKLGVPGHEELAMGAIASGDAIVVNQRVVAAARVSDDAMRAVVDRERDELARRERAYRGDRPPPHLEGRTVVLVDDGLATGSTMRAAVEAVRAQNPGRLIVAVPVAPAQAVDALRAEVDAVVVVATPAHFHAVGQAYRDFSQTTDAEVRELLAP
jgi:putative phosphoribosyl transferase